MIWADKDKLEKIIYNLLSNAFKFTPDGGEVDIYLSVQAKDNYEENAVITIRDNGSGIEEDKIPHIFERFFQVDQISNVQFSGSGLGLALVKKYVELHVGSISVKSTPGTGSEFIVYLPLGKSHFNENTRFTDQNYSDNKELLKASIGEYIPANNENDEITDTKGKSTILLIEDDNNLRAYLKETLAEYYYIEEASNSETGFNIAVEKTPDLIVCDVNLPDTSGFQLCSRLKEDIKTSHLPIILLTALAGQENHMEGIKAGADAYITKPFDLQHLMINIENLIEGRRKLLKRFNKGVIFETDDSIASTPDKKFLNLAVKCVEENMNNFSFNVEMLCSDLNLSQPQVYRKIKSLTDMNISEFIRNIRLKKAAQLLKSGNYKINEAAYETGFNDPNYFTKAFVKLFGTTPSDYMKSL